MGIDLHALHLFGGDHHAALVRKAEVVPGCFHADGKIVGAGEIDGGTKVDAQALGPQRAPELDSDAEEAAPVDRVAGRGSLDHSIRHQAGLA